MRAPVIGFVLLLAACEPADPSPFATSCRGERYLDCDPYEYGVATLATLTPAMLSPLDGSTRAHFRVEIETCELSTAPITVAVQARLEGARDDAGVPSVRLVELTTLRDDGTSGDAVAGDGVIDVMVENPFGPGVSPSTDLFVRFVPVIGGCDGEAIEIPYRTGERITP